MSDRKQRATGSHRPEAVTPVPARGTHTHLPPATRIEFFSDAVFAFSATLLVVALEVPHSYPELERTLWGFLGFAMSFVALALIWSTHHAYFRRYQLADRATVALNSILLFVVLFYVYPLKFMTTSLVDVVIGLHPERRNEMFRSQDDVGRMFVVYGLGFLAVFGCFSLLYRHAARSASTLELTPWQLHEAQMLQRHYLMMAGVGALSVVLALADVGARFGVPGFVYVLIGPLAWAHGVWSERRAPPASA
ncbi:MAG TPA: TMEM175 family protein [Thermoanaerobaculia bacterium]|nr:TMEM175 family protein [Thermoanaerobaculia bacterium]